MFNVLERLTLCFYRVIMLGGYYQFNALRIIARSTSESCKLMGDARVDRYQSTYPFGATIGMPSVFMNYGLAPVAISITAAIWKQLWQRATGRSSALNVRRPSPKTRVSASAHQSLLPRLYRSLKGGTRRSQDHQSRMPRSCHQARDL